MIEGFSLVCRLVSDVHNSWWTFLEYEAFVQLLAQPQDWEKQSPHGNFSITVKIEQLLKGRSLISRDCWGNFLNIWIRRIKWSGCWWLRRSFPLSSLKVKVVREGKESAWKGVREQLGAVRELTDLQASWWWWWENVASTVRLKLFLS